MLLSKDQILQSDRLYRTTLINSLAGYKTPVLVGTTNGAGQNNLALFNSLMHIGANPPLLGLLSRPATVPRHTLENILHTKVFTINLFSTKYIENAHHTAAKFPADQSEFEAAHWTPEFHADFQAPFVKEAVIKIALSLEEHHTLKSNQTVLLVGAVNYLSIPDHAVTEEGWVRMDLLNIPAVQGLENYLSVEHLFQLDHPSIHAWPCKK
jgi:flavin reductase (DIM6/NTAB) family NADH-FMN oxidoreductase RutF